MAAIEEVKKMKQESWKSLPKSVRKATKVGQIKAYDQAMYLLHMEQKKEIEELTRIEQEPD